MRNGLFMMIARVLLLCATLGFVARAHAQTAPTSDAPPDDPSGTSASPAPATSGASVPPPPSNYAVPQPPVAPPRYPAAPNLAPATATVDPNEADQSALQLRVPARIATRLRILSTDLNTLAARGGGGIADGIFSIVTGGVLITLGVVFQSSNDLNFLSPQLYVFGGTSVARGLIDLIIVPNPYNVMLEYSHLPMTTVDEVKTRLRFGEGALEELSDRNRLARLLDGAVSLGAAATLVGLTLSVNNDNATTGGGNSEIVMVMGLLGAATLAIGGVISLLSSSDAERRWEAYQGLRERLSRDRARAQEHTAVTSDHAFKSVRSFAPRAQAVITPQLVMGTLTVSL